MMTVSVHIIPGTPRHRHSCRTPVRVRLALYSTNSTVAFPDVDKGGGGIQGSGWVQVQLMTSNRKQTHTQTEAYLLAQ